MAKNFTPGLIITFVILGLFLLLTATSVAAYYLIKNSEVFDQVVNKVEKVKEEIKDFEEPASDSKPTKPQTQTPPQEPSVTIKNKVVNNGEVVKDETCYIYKITESNFESQKCYVLADYQAISKAVNNYRSAKSKLSGAQATIDITCDSEWEPFVESCKEAKDDEEDAKGDIDEYTKVINNLISKGK